MENGEVGYCEECGETFLLDDLIYCEDNDRYYCERCAERSLVQCETCGEWHTKDNICGRIDPDTGEVHFFCESHAEDWDDDHPDTDTDVAEDEGEAPSILAA